MIQNQNIKPRPDKPDMQSKLESQYQVQLMTGQIPPQLVSRPVFKMSVLYFMRAKLVNNCCWEISQISQKPRQLRLPLL